MCILRSLSHSERLILKPNSLDNGHGMKELAKKNQNNDTFFTPCLRVRYNMLSTLSHR